MVMSTPIYSRQRSARTARTVRSVRRVETPAHSRARVQTGHTARPRPVHGRRALVLGFLAAGAVLQHIMVSPSPELTLTPARLAGAASAAPSMQQAPFAAQPLAAAPPTAPRAGGANSSSAPTSGWDARHSGVGAAGAGARPSVTIAGAVPATPGAVPRLVVPVVVPAGGGSARPAATPRRAPATVPASAVAAPAQTVTAPGDAALAASIWRAFNTYALPYQADSALLVDVGRQFGIDPAIPAALFMHEDGNINNRTLFPDHMNWLLYHTHNPGNIKCMYDPCYGGFQVYPTYRAGILDWFRLYDHYYVDLGIHDLARFVATYCPPNVDGNGPPARYQSDVQAIAARIHGE